MAMVGRRAPDFDLPCTRGDEGTRGRIRLMDFADRWLVLVFFPRDFSLVCPTELSALSRRIDDFRDRSCDILGVSTDSLDTHERWMNAPPSQSGLGGLGFPLASDENGEASRAYGVYLERQHIALRGLFIIDPNGVLQYQVVHNVSVGRRVDEVLRVLAALETGGMCPENWCSECQTLDLASELLPGAILGQYRVEERVGEGTFAVVFRARDTVLDRTVALKVFKAESLDGSVDFLEEARAAAALNHPNVCTIFSAEVIGGVPVIAMEYVDGSPLETLLRDGPLDQQQVARFTRQIASGLAAAHAHNIVHGDLKPANIMVTADGQVRITDFGLSRRVSGQQTATIDWTTDSPGAIAGTPGYMSPEQARGESANPASDVFSLGTVVFEMLTGRRAFEGENVLKVLDQIQHVEPQRLAMEAPRPFSEILPGMLTRDYRDRLVTMDRIVQLLG
jgi:alkyl hydroperoxide reductase subunit AhpC/tRNA A-37 threonylcarbamoyl transferase component Bud32